ncbi:hypothetical protein MMUC44124_05905 [Mycolicibacterium mucogenicum DSM 44124]|nr:hypothetical protein MMUC44124_05905 [Mycolicibacterium mucogenicum DSM 44124]
MRDEVAGKPCGAEEFAECLTICHAARQLGAGEPVETRHLGEQAQVTRGDHRAGCGEQARQPLRAGVLQAAAFAADRHRHVGFLGPDTEFGEQPQQRRIGAVVVHDEAGVDADDGGAAAAGRQLMGVRVATAPRLCLEQGDFRVAGEHPG